jgi:predicted dehydrogenase|tara:strand:- start:115 stop:1032 length:918 start_codon:yes stop_codon:yes gene_type:complete
MRILILGNSNIFQRKIYPALHRIKNLKLELASKRLIGNNMKIDKLYNSYSVAIKETTAKVVYISLVNSQHYLWAIKSLKNNKHVIIDKPITLNFNHTKKLIDIARKKKLFISEAIVFNKHASFKKMYSKINLRNKTKIFCKFHIPKLEKENFRNFNKYGGGCFHDMSPYASSLINLFFPNTKYTLIYNIKKNKKKVVNSLELKVTAKNTYLEASFSFDSIYKNQIEIHNQNKKYFLNYVFSPPINKLVKLNVYETDSKKKYDVIFPKQNIFYTYFKQIFRIIRNKKYNYFYNEIETIAKIKKKIS